MGRLANDWSRARRGDGGSRRWGRSRGLHSGCPSGCILRGLFRGRFLFGLNFRLRKPAEMLADLFRSGNLNGTRMRFLLGYSGLGQKINDRLGLDLELASQFINSNLIRIGHSPPGLFLAVLMGRSFRGVTGLRGTRLSVRFFIRHNLFCFRRRYDILGRDISGLR